MDFDDIASEDLTKPAAARLAHAAKARELSDWARASVPVLPSQLALTGRDGAPMTSAAMTLVLLAEQALRTAVVADRAAGASWDSVGEALNVSRQAAHKRWAQAEVNFEKARARLQSPAAPFSDRAMKKPGEMLAELECWFQLSPDDTMTGLGRPAEPGDVADALVATSA